MNLIKFFFSRSLILFFIVLPGLAFGNEESKVETTSNEFPEKEADFSNYLKMKNWKEIFDADKSIQALFVKNLELKGYKNRITLVSYKTPIGNVVPELGGTCLPLSGLVVTHSMDLDVAQNNDLANYLAEGYDSIGVDKVGNIFIRGSAFLRTLEDHVPNRSTINITFDVNAERRERVNSAQIKTAADIAEALQRAFTSTKTQVKIFFKDHHEKGFKEGKNYLEAGPARDAANERLKKLE